MSRAEILKREFWTDKRGNEIHRDLVPHEEKLKTELVYHLVDRAARGVELLRRFKGDVVAEIDDYMEMMREKYNLDVTKGTKGNVTLQSYDGLRKVMIAVHQHVDFNEKLTLAKEKIDDYLKELTKDADPAIRTLVMKAFEVDKKGNVDAKKIKPQGIQNRPREVARGDGDHRRGGGDRRQQELHSILRARERRGEVARRVA